MSHPQLSSIISIGFCLNSTINIFLDVSSQSSNLKGCQDDGPRVECDQGNLKAPIRQSGSSLPRPKHLSNWSSHHLDQRLVNCNRSFDFGLGFHNQHHIKYLCFDTRSPKTTPTRQFSHEESASHGMSNLDF